VITRLTLIHSYEVDVQMLSPPNSPSQLQGASRTVGGFARGRAHGNVFNFADAPDLPPDQPLLSNKGKVLLYTTMGDPETTKPAMSLKHEVCSTIGPVLAKLGKRYTPIDRMLFYYH
jgi:hypothetical protein